MKFGNFLWIKIERGPIGIIVFSNRQCPQQLCHVDEGCDRYVPATDRTCSDTLINAKPRASNGLN
jgi:hypothetical protein